MTDKPTAPESASKASHDKLVARVKKLEAQVEHVTYVVSSSLGLDASLPEPDED